MANYIGKDYVTTRETKVWDVLENSPVSSSSSFVSTKIVTTIPKGTKIHIGTSNTINAGGGGQSIAIWNIVGGFIKGEDIKSLRLVLENGTAAPAKNANMKYLYLAVIGVAGFLAYKKFKK